MTPKTKVRISIFKIRMAELRTQETFRETRIFEKRAVSDGFALKPLNSPNLVSPKTKVRISIFLIRKAKSHAQEMFRGTRIPEKQAVSVDFSR